MTTEIAAQLVREEAMLEQGKHRAQQILDRAMKNGRAAETPAGVVLAKRAIAPLSEALQQFLNDAYSGKAGRRHTAAVLLKDVPIDLAAFIAVRIGISQAVAGASLRSSALAIGKALADELLAEEFEVKEEALYRSVIRNAANRGLSTPRTAVAVNQANKKFELFEARWTLSEAIVVGSKLIELAIDSLGLIEIYTKKTANRAIPTLRVNETIDKWVQEYNAASTLMRPVYLPTVIPPQKWEGVKGSPYYGTSIRQASILTKATKDHLDRLSKASMPAVYEGLNAIQETPWRINRRVLEVMEQAWERDAGLACLPRREDEQLPESPPEVVNDEVGGPHRKAWRLVLRAIYERINANRSKRFEITRAMAIARDYADEKEIFFPHRLDFRGRCYAAATSLTPQGADHSKGLLEFAEGKPLGERGLFWLGVHGANLFGNDKVSLDDRFAWAKEHEYMARLVAHDPLSNLWWTEADSPWCFLAWCFEWAEAHTYANPGKDFVSHLPIALDGSCNGIQHFSAMLRDPVGGASVNLVPADKPSDIYGKVAEVTVAKLQAEADPDKQWMAQSWVAFGITRKITKRAVMVLPYGGTFKSCMDYVREAVREKIEDGTTNPFGDAMPKAAAYLAAVVWSAIGEVVVAARDAMGWLQACARVANAAGVPLVWETPSGFVGVQDYKELSELRIKTRFQGTIIKFASADTTDKIDTGKQVSAISPNFVHSLDATAMMLTIVSCQKKGINAFAMIHDSYGTHAADTDMLATTLREEFVRMYEENDVLQQFADALRPSLPPEFVDKLPPPPAKGSLDLQQVLQSTYFFA